MFLDLRYDVGNQERFLNSPYTLKQFRKLGFALFVQLLKMIFRR